MFSRDKIIYRNNSFQQMILKSDIIILSSHDALKDLKNFAPGHENRAKVLQFVSQPDKKYFHLKKK